MKGVTAEREGMSTLNLNLTQRNKTSSRRGTINRRAFGNLYSGVDEWFRPFIERNQGREVQNLSLFKQGPVLCQGAHRKQARVFFSSVSKHRTVGGGQFKTQLIMKILFHGCPTIWHKKNLMKIQIIETQQGKAE